MEEKETQFILTGSQRNHLFSALGKIQSFGDFIYKCDPCEFWADNILHNIGEIIHDDAEILMNEVISELPTIPQPEG